jgi:transposase
MSPSGFDVADGARTQLLARRPFKVVAIALANKMARVAWALLARGGTYRVPALAAA